MKAKVTSRELRMEVSGRVSIVMNKVAFELEWRYDVKPRQLTLSILKTVYISKNKSDRAALEYACMRNKPRDLLVRKIVQNVLLATGDRLDSESKLIKETKVVWHDRK